MNSSSTLTIDALDTLLKYSVSPHRYNHSVGVAQMAEKLAIRFKEDAHLAYIAGLAHDIQREVPTDELIGMARSYCLLEPNGISYPMILHGRLAKLVLKQHFNYENGAVSQAMAHHTGCGEVMTTLDKILFVADTFENGRPYVTPAITEKIETASLDSLFFMALTVNIKFLNEQKKPVYPETLKWFTLMKELHTK